MIPSPLSKDAVHAPGCICCSEHVQLSNIIAAVRLAEHKMMTDFDMLGKIEYEGFTLRDEELARSKHEGARREILRCLGKLREAFPVAYEETK